ncbi:MAG: helix-turn-helix domain-containing protein [Lentimicrobiaceae bacterium]|nr:helix-turn-helix domain-containing protein [Lentimicrobiaceae bacterium]
MKKNKAKKDEPKKSKPGRPTKAERDIKILEIQHIEYGELKGKTLSIEYSYPPEFNINQGIFTRLTYYMNTHGHSYYHLGKTVGVSHNYFSNIKKNNSSIGSEIIARILYYYRDLSADWLLLGEGEMTRGAKSEQESKELIKRNKELEKLYEITDNLHKQIETLKSWKQPPTQHN